ncbi:MAG: autotransporter domain-containing protein, partial [Proteobacteria bacterium]|nr:autotransporter domain-containing protein [Pseudomonadota bacterium]
MGTVRLSNGVISGGTLSGTSYVVEAGTISAVLAGSGITLTKNTVGSVLLSAANTYTGTTTVGAGTLSLGVDNALALGTSVVVSGGELALGTTTQSVAALTLNGGLLSGGTLTGTSYAVNAGTISAVLAGGSIVLTKNEGGTVLLTGANTYGGGTVVNAGTLFLGGDERLLASGALTQNGGVFNLGGFTQTLGAVALTAGTITSGTLSGASYSVLSGDISANLAGSGALTKTSTGLVTLTGANSYSGGTSVNAGTLALGVNNTLLSSGAVTVNGGELALGITSQTVGALSLTGGVISGGTLSGTSYTVVNGTISSILTGAGIVLTKNDSGTVLLSGVNTYGGGTVVNAGTLLLGGNERLLSAGSVELNGGVFNLGGNVQTTATVTLNGGAITNGTLSGGSYAVRLGDISAKLIGSGALTKTSPGLVTLSGLNSYSGGTTVTAGTLALGVD